MGDEIKAGDVVSLLPTATYYDGRIIPAWVKKYKWFVKKVDGDRIVIDQNTEGEKCAINSPVHRKNLEKVPRDKLWEK